MVTTDYSLIESDLRDRLSRRVRASVQEAATLAVEINALIERRNAMTGRRAA